MLSSKLILCTLVLNTGAIGALFSLVLAFNTSVLVLFLNHELIFLLLAVEDIGVDFGFVRFFSHMAFDLVLVVLT